MGTIGTPDNEALWTYNALGMLAKEYQDHAGAAATTDPNVQYELDDDANASGVYNKGMRLKAVRYPNGRKVHYTYGSSGGVDDDLSRVAAVKADSGGSPGATLASYSRTGDGRIVVEDYQDPNVRLDFRGQAAGKYSGFDRFGRIVWQRWVRSNGEYADAYFYGHDRNSNRTWRAERHDPADANGKRDEAYEYDNLNRLTGFKRGVLPSGTYQAPYPGDTDRDGDADFADFTTVKANYGSNGATWADGDFDGDGDVDFSDYTNVSQHFGQTPSQQLSRQESWTLSIVGNWDAFKHDDNGDGNYGGAGDANQTRTHNKVNEITGINESSTHIGYGAKGNMIKAPKPGSETTAHYTCSYDAWNRLVEVKDGSTVVAQYRYDGLHRRIAKMKRIADNNWDRTDYYYTASWQVIEERLATGRTDETKGNVATSAKYQYVWSQRYIDAAVCRDEDKNGDGDCTDAQGAGGSERLYYANGGNMEVTALLSASGAVVERYVYDPYGKVTIYDDDWSQTVAWADSKKNEVLYCGYRYNPETGLYQVRYRELHPTMAWMQRDPLGYHDGMNTYEYAGSSAATKADAFGMCAGPQSPPTKTACTPGDVRTVDAGDMGGTCTRMFPNPGPYPFIEWHYYCVHRTAYYVEVCNSKGEWQRGGTGYKTRLYSIFYYQCVYRGIPPLFIHYEGGPLSGDTRGWIGRDVMMA